MLFKIFSDDIFINMSIFSQKIIFDFLNFLYSIIHHSGSGFWESSGSGSNKTGVFRENRDKPDEKWTGPVKPNFDLSMCICSKEWGQNRDNTEKINNVR